jgi:hypothetical protein
MDQPVMAPAHQDEVVHGGRATIGPVFDVMGVAPRRGAVAAGEATVAIAHDHGTTHRYGHDSRAPSDVERLGAAPSDHACDRGVADQTAYGLGVDWPGVVKLAPVPSPALQRPEIDDH